MLDNVLPHATLEEAVAFAARAHEGQKRKGTDMPYIVHPIEVAAICARLTDDQATIMAGVLHDVVEDTDATFEEIEAKFGIEVASIVAGESEDKLASLPPSSTWRQRKQATIDHIRAAGSMGELIVCLADKLSNMRSIRHDYAVLGKELWSRFNMDDPRQHAWYYQSLADALNPRLGDTLEWRELEELIREVFGEA